MSVAGDLITLDPDAVNDPRGFDWTNWLAEIDPAEIISNSSWSVSGPDAAVTLSGSSIVTGQKQTQVRLSGGTAGRKYRLTNHITTSSGVEEDQSSPVLVQNK